MNHAESRTGAAIAGAVLLAPALFELAFGHGTALGAHLIAALLGLGLIVASITVHLH